MKKFLALLLTVAMVFAMAACSAPAAEETKPAEEGTAAPAEETSEQPAASGSVYYLNFSDFRLHVERFEDTFQIRRLAGAG